MSNDTDSLDLGDRTTTMFFKLPLSLKEHLDHCAQARNETTSYLVRLGITRILGLPDYVAKMGGIKQRHTDHTPSAIQQRNTERKRKARRIQQQLATLAPEVLNELNRGIGDTNGS